MRSRFDQFAKHMLREALAPAGLVETDAEVSPDAQRVDVWFVPDPAKHRDRQGLQAKQGRSREYEPSRALLRVALRRQNQLSEPPNRVPGCGSATGSMYSSERSLLGWLAYAA